MQNDIAWHCSFGIVWNVFFSVLFRPVLDQFVSRNAQDFSSADGGCDIRWSQNFCREGLPDRSTLWKENISAHFGQDESKKELVLASSFQIGWIRLLEKTLKNELQRTSLRQNSVVSGFLLVPPLRRWKASNGGVGVPAKISPKDLSKGAGNFPNWKATSGGLLFRHLGKTWWKSR